jgi:hypothetical protein
LFIIEEDTMATDARAKIVAELLAEFVEERVRQWPKKPFGLSDVTRALGTMLRDSDTAIELKRADEPRLSDWLDQHPFLRRAASGSSGQWTPGLNKQALRKRA